MDDKTHLEDKYCPKCDQLMSQEPIMVGASNCNMYHCKNCNITRTNRESDKND